MKANDSNNKNPISQAVEEWFANEGKKENSQNAFFHYLKRTKNLLEEKGGKLNFGRATVSFIENTFAKDFVFPGCSIGQDPEQKSPWVIRSKEVMFYPSNLNMSRLQCRKEGIALENITSAKAIFLFSECIFDFQPDYLALLNSSLKNVFGEETALIFTPETYHELCPNLDFTREKTTFNMLFEHRYEFDAANIRRKITQLKAQDPLDQKHIDLLQAQADSYDRIAMAITSHISTAIEKLSSKELKKFLDELPLEKFNALNNFATISECLRLFITFNISEDIQAKKKIILSKFTDPLKDYKNFSEFEKLFVPISDLGPSDIPDELLDNWLKNIPPKFINLIERHCPNDAIKSAWLSCCIEKTKEISTFFYLVHSAHIPEDIKKNFPFKLEIIFNNLGELIHSFNLCENAETQEFFLRYVLQNSSWDKNLYAVLQKTASQTELIDIFKACKSPVIQLRILRALSERTITRFVLNADFSSHIFSPEKPIAQIIQKTNGFPEIIELLNVLMPDAQHYLVDSFSISIKSKIATSVTTFEDFCQCVAACKNSDVMQKIVSFLPKKVITLVKEKISHDIDCLIKFLSACHLKQMQWGLLADLFDQDNGRSTVRNALLDNQGTLNQITLLLQTASQEVNTLLFSADKIQYVPFLHFIPLFVPNTEFHAIWDRIISLILTRNEFVKILRLLSTAVQTDFVFLSTPDRNAKLAKTLQKDTPTFDELDKILTLLPWFAYYAYILNLYPDEKMQALITEPRHLKRIFTLHQLGRWTYGIYFIHNLDKEENKKWLKNFMITKVRDIDTLSDTVSASGDPKIWQLLRECYSDDELLSLIKTPDDLIVRLQLPEKLGYYASWYKPPELYLYTYTVWALEDFKTEPYKSWLKRFMKAQVQGMDTLCQVVLACKDPEMQQTMISYYSDENFLFFIKTPDDWIRLSQLRKILNSPMPFIANLARDTHKIWLQDFIQEHSNSFDKMFIECDNNDMRKILIDHYDLGTHIKTNTQYLSLRKYFKTDVEKRYFDARVGEKTLQKLATQPNLLVLQKDSPLMRSSSKTSLQQPPEDPPTRLLKPNSSGQH